MQLLIDCIRLQKEKGRKISNLLIENATKELQLGFLIDTLQSVFSTAIDEKLPIEDAFVYAHVCALTKKEPDWEKWLKEFSKQKPMMGQRDTGMNLLRKIHNESNRNANPSCET